MNEKAIVNGSKGLVAMISAVFSFMAQSINGIFIVLVIAMAADYVTGIWASYVEKNIDSSQALGKFSLQRGLMGGLKKIGYIILVGTAILLDYTIYYLGNTAAGIDLGIKGMFTLLVTCWLFATEIISLIENLGRIGVPIPNFLKNAFTKLKDTVEQVGSKEGNNNE